MIEVTNEMRAAFRADRDDWCDEIGCGRDDCLTERLAAVLAIVERDYDITAKVPPFDHRAVTEGPWWNEYANEYQAACTCGATFGGSSNDAQNRLRR